MPARKTFANNATLTATDLNTYLNPSTADHIADAESWVLFSIPALAAGAVQTIDVPLPANRFTVGPYFIPTSQHYRVTCSRVSATSTTARVQVFNNTSVASPATQGILYLGQMTPTNAAG